MKTLNYKLLHYKKDALHSIPYRNSQGSEELQGYKKEEHPLLYSLTGIVGVARSYKEGQPRTPFLEARNAGAEQLH